ncbi:phosphate ABC transporter substrate-binding protein PstS family protein [Pantoea sp. LMR881]|uniref:PstS family phosphate ABC transporter substrate-binding protein n=1 Tax=Pantoea sp. LMR881 TaxID=3014336 RepID=UPI0022B05C3C|nr:phosphate ABC transporter substrate-binding protein PstS family protein [Pantoea sp. LMR881]MCZ4059125.1 phosphate ABC transporter substrate-binding protein PstS family protein [Pantoea sp. LMR881]
MRAFLCFLLLLLPAASQAQPDTLSGNLSSVGSDTLGYLMTLWGEDFSRQAPGVNVQVQASGSSTAPTALAAGAAQLGPMSRPMQAEERQAFEARYGYPPLAVPVAMDALVVVVNQRNPLQHIDPRQLDAIFSITRLCGSTQIPAHWGDLGVKQADWANRSLQRYGRNSASGTWGFFKQQALCRGDFRSDVAEFPGSAAVVQAVARNPRSIGYASFGFHLSGVKMLSIVNASGEAVAPDVESIRNGRYPWARPLYLYVNKAPDKPLPPLVAAFLQQVLSAQGQRRVSEAGYLPLSDSQMAQARAALE